MNLFNLYKPVIGMIHVAPLPGTPRCNDDVKRIIEKAKEEARIYTECGVPALMIENMHDAPYLNRNTGPEIVSMMSVILYELKQHFNQPMGIQILAGANKAAIAAAHAAGAQFIRAEGFVFSHIADEGMFNSDAGELLRYRKSIDAGEILVFTDIKKKHSSHTITADTDIAETAKAAEFFLSDGVIVTGGSTGHEPSLKELEEVKSAVNIPVLAGSGITAENIKDYARICDALIIGSYFKQEGKWFNPIDPAKVEKLISALNK